jgi:imidazoleglycerol phosphate dehydratase HisB
MTSATARRATISRQTRETKIELELTVDGTGGAEIDTGLGFLDHMLTALCRHGRLDLKLACAGDLHVDDHHTVEDCGLALGTAIDRALGERRGIQRFGFAYAPLDESLVRAVVDLSGRGGAWVELPFKSDRIGAVASENIGHFFRSMALAMRGTLHMDTLRSGNDHHLAEAAFKSVALALRQAVARDGGNEAPSTKGML